MKPIAAVVTAALISGVAMYTVGAKTAEVDALTQPPAVMQTLDGTNAVGQPGVYTALRSAEATPGITLASNRQSAQRGRTVYRNSVSQRERERERELARERAIERERDDRSWGKTAMIIGGSAAGGAGVGAIVGGGKGAAVGAAIGGGAASIYEATRRR